MGEDSRIRCYDCKDMSVPYKKDLDYTQECTCVLCGTKYNLRVYGKDRLVVMGRSEYRGIQQKH